jgi:hypothetical protein
MSDFRRRLMRFLQSKPARHGRLAGFMLRKPVKRATFVRVLFSPGICSKTRQKMMRHTPKGRMIGPAIFRMVMMIVALFALVPGLLAQNNPVPESAPAPEASSNRFLFVLDVSASMRKHTQDVVNVVETVLRSSASGQLHNGDTIGVWNFNDDVFTGRMPLETWSADDGEEITLRIAEFIRQQDYEKSSRLDIAMKPVGKVINMSDIITVFIISSGAGPIKGTPYDDEINAQYQACLHDMGKKPMPIVTVLQGKDGKFIRYTVNALPWPVVIPELPIRVKLPNAQPAAPAPAVTSTPPAAASPASPSVTEDAAPPPAQPPPAPPLVVPVPVSPPLAAASPGVISPGVVPPGGVPPGVVPPMVAPVSVASTGSPPAVQSQFTPPPMPIARPTPPPPAEVPAPPAPAPVAAPPVAQTGNTTPAPPPEPVVKPATSEQLPLVPPRQPPLVPKTLPADAVMAEHPVPASPTPAPLPAVAAPQSASAPPAQAPPKTLVAQASALIKSFTAAHRGVLLIGGVGLLVVASALILLMARRGRPAARVSLITQTMDERHR